MSSLLHKARSRVFSTFSDSKSGVSPNNTPVAENASIPPGGIPKNVLAFRTITTLLAKIQQEKPVLYTNLDQLDLSSDKANELRISTVFANVANTDVDVIAIATTLSMNKVKVIACTNRDNSDELVDRSPPSMISDIWRILFSSNPLSNDNNGHTGEDQIPYMAHTAALLGMKPDDPETLKNYIKNEWCVDCLPSQHTFTSYSIAIKGSHL